MFARVANVGMSVRTRTLDTKLDVDLPQEVGMVERRPLRWLDEQGCGARFAVMTRKADTVHICLHDPGILAENLGYLGSRDVLTFPPEGVAESRAVSRNSSCSQQLRISPVHEEPSPIVVPSQGISGTVE